MSPHKLDLYFFFAVFFVVLTISVFIFYPYLYALTLSVIFAIIFKPLYYKILNVVKNRRALAAILTILVVFSTVVAPLVLIGGQIFKEAQELYAYLTVQGGDFAIATSLENFVNNLSSNFISSYKPLNISDKFDVNVYVQAVLNWLFKNVGSLLSSVASITVSSIVFLFAFYYLLKDGKKFKEKLIALSPLPDKHDEEISNKVEMAINYIIRGAISVALIQGFLTGLGFYLFGIQSPAFWGAAAAVASFIPGLGTALVALPATIFLFLKGDTLSAFGLLAWASVAVGLVDNFIGPKLVQHGTKIHSFFILVSALGGLSFFGPIGFLLGPIILSLLFALVDVYFLIRKEVF